MEVEDGRIQVLEDDVGGDFALVSVDGLVDLELERR